MDLKDAPLKIRFHLHPDAIPAFWEEEAHQLKNQLLYPAANQGCGCRLPGNSQFQPRRQLLQLAPYKGATVMAITSDFIAEASELTSALELLMLPHAMEAGFSDEHIQELETINKAFEESISQQDARPRRLNEKFHIALFKNCKDSIAFGLFDRYFKTMYAYARNWPDNPERMASQVHEHQAIIDAIKANDVQRAVQALQYHESTAKTYLSEKTIL